VAASTGAHDLMHDLKIERFFQAEMVNCAMMFGNGPIKTSSLRGVKDNPARIGHHDCGGGAEGLSACTAVACVYAAR
jgi:hypothetical protein